MKTMGFGSSEVAGHAALSLPMICVVENEVVYLDSHSHLHLHLHCFDEVEEHINLDYDVDTLHLLRKDGYVNVGMDVHMHVDVDAVDWHAYVSLNVVHVFLNAVDHVDGVDVFLYVVHVFLHVVDMYDADS